MSSNAFSNLFWEDIESLNFVTAFVSEILLVRTISASTTMYHVLSMKYFVDVTLFTPK